MNGEEEKEQEKEVIEAEVEPKVYEKEEEGFIDFLKRFKPSVLVVIGMLILVIILAWILGYSMGYGDCLVMHNAKMLNCTVF